MSSLDSLKSITTRAEMAKLLQFKPASFAYVLFKQPNAAKYKTFEVPKRSGGKRTIHAPIDALKLIQRKLSVLLQDCVDEINTAKNLQNRVSHGFTRKRSIITNARRHRNRRYVFNLDLEDFFPSIHFGRVRGFFIKDRNFALHEDVATVIAQIACREKTLPQGSPCSPVISNLIAHVLDMHLVRLASRVGCTYSRYADDLTFSTNKKVFPSEIAVQSGTDPNLWVPGEELQRLITHAGFLVNKSKTHMQYRTSRQNVTGLVVNRRINVRQEYRHNTRAMVHRLLNTGGFEVYGKVEKSGVLTLEKRPGKVNELHGMLGFIDNIDLDYRKNTPGWKPSDELSSNELMYQRFLIYVNFFAAERPVVLCEGKTDNIYLTHAIRSLALDYPYLATAAPDGKIRLNIRLYKYRKSSTARILRLSDGGSSALLDFIVTYKRETEKFKGPGLKNAFIVLYDNDSGAKGIRNYIKGFAGPAFTGAEPFVHVFQNLYAVPTPTPAGMQSSKIEDYFDPSIKATVLHGKTFDDQNGLDTDTRYGKKVFAEAVVRPHAAKIDFDGFRPPLTNLEAAIKVHAAALSTTP
jgi:retron-type reverse transcriptase